MTTHGLIPEGLTTTHRRSASPSALRMEPPLIASAGMPTPSMSQSPACTVRSGAAVGVGGVARRRGSMPVLIAAHTSKRRYAPSVGLRTRPPAGR